MKMKTMALVLVAAVLTLNNFVSAEDRQINVISTETLNKFRQHTTDLREQLKAKDLALRSLYTYDGLDTRRVVELEEDIKGIKAKIRSVAAGMNLTVINFL
ncbi:hypothetical protein FO488_12280 [Geobacter sp. FeAm09]|uniref:hypothetical protein n=1 Tax=Geobacter sp. FeAm09 TaxID=2597769 RepID=UPI0011EE9AB3|nr:hypothetical protein [Geobacter sp. FeAm09]QEM68855.1 hypothetical protein FO488_12280 [Geobacter sp. FeAm09]